MWYYIILINYKTQLHLNYETTFINDMELYFIYALLRDRMSVRVDKI